MSAANGTKLERDNRVDLDESVQVTLGDKTYAVYPQKIGRLRATLAIEFKGLEALADLGGGIDSVIGAGLERAHSILRVFIPDIMPAFEFCGYGTLAAMEADEYIEDNDTGPTVPQVRRAFEEVMALNGLDLLKHLGKIFSPDLIQTVVQEQVLLRLASETPSLPTSQPASGDSPPTTSGTAPLTSVPSPD